MGLLGNIPLVTSLILSVFSLMLLIIIKNIKWGIRAAISSCAFIVLSSSILLYLLISSDFSVEYVFRNTERNLPLIYKISAFWSGSAGSLLLWALCNCLVYFFIHLFFKKRNQNYLKCQAAVTTVINLVFLVALLFFNNPFKSTAAGSDGFGLNPSLQSIGMVFHPPAIILSYSCIFAAFGSYLYELIYSGSPEAKAARLKAARLFSLFSWIILTAGIVTGGIWAYGELGWGGYWSWDPIENSALVTWLLLTAHLHISGHNKSTGRSPIVLISCTALSVLLGTFLARSGIISSVHAYSSRAGKTVFFLTVLIVAAICLSAFLTVFRKRHRSGTYEFSFNRMARRLPPCLMVLCAVIIALMTISPLFPFEGLNITEKTYDFVFGILGMLILLNLTIYFTLKNKSNKLRILIVTVSLVTGLITLLQPNMASFSVFTRIALVICAFCITSFVLSFISATGKSFSNTGCFLLYIIHLSIVILALGFTGSRNMKTEARIILNKNTTVSMGSYILEMTDFHIFDEPEMKAWNAALSFFDGKKNKDIKITLTHYKKKNMYHSKAYISSSFREDLYIIIENATDDGDILLKVSLYRWVSLIWLGIALMISAAVFLCFRKIPNDS